jgi:hypothetical protein
LLTIRTATSFIATENNNLSEFSYCCDAWFCNVGNELNPNALMPEIFVPTMMVLMIIISYDVMQ